MAPGDAPRWIGAATAAAVRLAAEAGAEVDDLLEHAGDTPPALLAITTGRLEQSAELAEVATDLAGLLWAECEDVPPIATILEEPAAQAALEAVAESRRLAAARLAAASPIPSARPHFWLPETPEVETREDEPAAAAEPVPPPPPIAVPAAALPDAVAAPPARRPAAGAVVAGAAAAAILLFGRRLRRA